jgi:hypothetical protein
MELRGFEPLTSAVQRRLEGSATVRFHPECAANARFLMIGVGYQVRPGPLDTAWVGVRFGVNLVSSRSHAYIERKSAFPSYSISKIS